MTNFVGLTTSEPNNQLKHDKKKDRQTVYAS